MNPAAIHYHYGSKQALVLAVARRRADPVNRRRLKALDRLEAEAGDQAVPVERLLEAFLRPELVDNPAPLCAILHHERREIVEQVVPHLFGEVHDRFLRAARRTLPELPQEDLELRFRLVVGVMLHVLRGFADLPVGEATPLRALSGEERLEKVLHFVVAAFRAPCPSRARPEAVAP